MKLNDVSGDLLICQECGGNYHLKNGESLDDFLSCECGGQLKYSAKSEIKTETKLKETKNLPYLPLDLILIFIITIISIIFLSNNILNDTFIINILAIPLLLFLPGYVLLAVLYPKNDDLENMERAAFSFGLSVLIAPTIGLILYYTRFGIDFIIWLILLSIFTFLLCIIAYIIRWRLESEDRFVFKFKNIIN